MMKVKFTLSIQAKISTSSLSTKNIDELKEMDEEIYSPEVKRDRNRDFDNKNEGPIKDLNTDFEIPDEDEDDEINYIDEQFRNLTIN